MYEGYYSWLAGGDTAPQRTSASPKNETLAEHREHCRARPGNCPFERAALQADSLLPPTDGQVSLALPPPAALAEANFRAEMTGSAQVVPSLGGCIVAVGDTCLGYSFDSVSRAVAAFRAANPVGAEYPVGPSGATARIWQQSASEFTNSKTTDWLRHNDTTACRAKLALIPHLKDVLANAAPLRSGVPPEHTHSRNPDHYASFDYFAVRWAVRKPMKSVMLFSGRVVCNRHKDGTLCFLDIVDVSRLA